ncbi:hypothetical protein K474DRAFT_1605051 [Panus rudis PR-1116 ss-1]|nr:hypothetical protein K474DRAFT_1605051 [Panus rudis PR-1116 ss-1]
MSKHFCCCIPVRAGVFIFSFLAFLLSGAAAFFAWFALHEILEAKVEGGVDFSKINQSGKIAVIVAACLFTIAALFSLFGFIGSIFRKRKLVRTYGFLTWLIFIIHLVGAGFYFYLVFSGKNLFSGCTITVNGKEQDCKVTLPLWQKIVSVVVVIVELFINLYIAVIVRRYGDQLEEEHDYSHEYKLAKNTKHSSSTYEPTYYPPTAQDGTQGLLNPNPPYPYTDSRNAFGSHA